MSDLESDEPEEEAMYRAGLPKTLKITAWGSTYFLSSLFSYFLLRTKLLNEYMPA